MKTHSCLIGIAMLALASGLAACSKRTPPMPAAGTGNNLPSVAVRAQTVQARPHVATEEVTGSVRAKLQAAITPQGTARIEKMLVAPGQRVQQGETLAQLDASEAQAKLDQARAISVQAEQNLQRYSTLLTNQAVSRADYDTAVANNRVAQAALAQAQTAMGFMTIAAPFAGVITKKSADVGDLASPWKPILEMEDPTALRFEADVPEAVIGAVTNGASLAVRVGTVELTGTVAEITPVADAQSRTFLVKLDLPSAPGLRSGQFGRVAIPVSETTVLRVPASAVIQRGQMEIAFVIVNGRAQMRLVKTGKRLGGEVEIVSGLEGNEQVATEKVAQLVDGQSVSIQTP